MLLNSGTRLSRLVLTHRTGSQCLVRTLMSQHKALLSQESFMESAQLLQPQRQMELVIPVRSLKMFAPKKHYTPKHKEDGVSFDYEMVYHNNMWKYYEYSLPATLAIMVPVLALEINGVYNYWMGNIGFSPGNRFNKIHTLTDPFLFVCCTSVFFTVILFAVYKVSRLYIARIYYNSKKEHYIAIVKKGLLFKDTQLHFTLRDVKPITNKKFDVGNVAIKGRSFLVNGKDFGELTHYNRLLGYSLYTPYEPDQPQDDMIKMGFKRDKKAKKTLK